MSKVLSFRVSDEESAWVERYVKERGSTRQKVLLSAFQGFRVECGRGVPDLAPVDSPPEVESALLTGAELAEARQSRQRRLAREMGWLS